jgi:hypothetical protein
MKDKKNEQYINRLNTLEYEIKNNIYKTNKELEEQRKIRRLKEEQNLEYNHTEEIIETYQKLLKIISEDGKPNKELMNIVFNMYAFAYEAGSTEESTKVHFFHRELFDVDTLLKQGHGELPIYEDNEEDEV